MKLVLLFLVLGVFPVKDAGGNFAEAQMYLSGTNDFIGLITFYERFIFSGVTISGYVNGLRPNVTLVRQLLYLASSILSFRSSPEIRLSLRERSILDENSP
jgi:hypothetical protein